MNIVTLPQLRFLRLEHCDIATVETSETSTLCVETGQMSSVARLTQDRCLFLQQMTSILSQQQTSVLSQQQTSVLSHQKTSGCFGVILGRSKMISTPFLHLKCAKWNTSDGAGGADGATETTPPAAPRSLVPHAPGARIT